MMSESVTVVMLIFFATPPIPIYFIGKGDDKTIITDTVLMKSVTDVGDKK